MSTALAWILFSVVGFVADPRGNGAGQSTITFPGGMTFRTEYAP